MHMQHVSKRQVQYDVHPTVPVDLKVWQYGRDLTKNAARGMRQR